VARPVDTGTSWDAGVDFDAALSILDSRAAGRGAARTATLPIVDVDPASVDPASEALMLFEGASADVAPTEGFNPAAPSEVAASPCAVSVDACGVNVSPVVEGAVEAVADSAAPSLSGISEVAGGGILPAEATDSVFDINSAPDGGGAGAGAAGAAVSGAADPIAGAATVGVAEATFPAAGSAGGKGDGEELPADGRWPPPGAPPAAASIVNLRRGFASASLNALAKSWLWAPLVAEFEAAALS